jgi:hypothetical protein
MLEVCAGDPARQRGGTTSKNISSQLLACFESTEDAAAEGQLVGRVTAVKLNADPETEFTNYKQAVRTSVDQLDGGREAKWLTGSGARVINVMSHGPRWVVHALVRATNNEGGHQAGVVTTGLVGDHLIYLSLWAPEGTQTDWPALGDTAQTWVHDLIRLNFRP